MRCCALTSRSKNWLSLPYFAVTWRAALQGKSSRGWLASREFALILADQLSQVQRQSPATETSHSTARWRVQHRIDAQISSSDGPRGPASAWPLHPLHLRAAEEGRRLGCGCERRHIASVCVLD